MLAGPQIEGLGSTFPTKNGMIVVTVTGWGVDPTTYAFQMFQITAFRDVILVGDCYMLELHPGKFTYFQPQKLEGGFRWVVLFTFGGDF